MIRQVKFDITTSSGGAYTSSVTTAPQSEVSKWKEGPVLLYAVEWIVNELDAGVDATLSMTDTISGTDKTLLTLTNADANAWYYPRIVENDNTGAATAFYTLQVVEGTLKLVIASGGNVQRGTCIVYLLEV